MVINKNYIKSLSEDARIRLNWYIGTVFVNDADKKAPLPKNVSSVLTKTDKLAFTKVAEWAEEDRLVLFLHDPEFKEEFCKKAKEAPKVFLSHIGLFYSVIGETYISGRKITMPLAAYEGFSPEEKKLYSWFRRLAYECSPYRKGADWWK